MAKGEGYIQNTMTLLVGNDASDAVRVPRNCNVVTFFQPSALATAGQPSGLFGPPILNIPTLVSGVDSVWNRYMGYNTDETNSWKIQTMVPTSSSDDAQDIIWADATYWSPEANAPRFLIFPYSANTALSFPCWMLGGGQIRITTHVPQVGASAVFIVYFSGFNN